MGILHGFAVLLITFFGVIIQCQGEDVKYYTYSMMRAKDKIRLAKECVVMIPHNNFIENHRPLGDVRETVDISGSKVLNFAHQHNLLAFLTGNNKIINKIRINCEKIEDSQYRETIIQYIGENAYRFQTVAINIQAREEIWDELVNGIKFPNVTRFEFGGDSQRQDFNLSLICPNVETIHLFGLLGRKNCLEGLTKLMDLYVMASSIEEFGVDPTFGESKETLMTLKIVRPQLASTMETIAFRMSQLEDLCVDDPGTDFFFQQRNGPIFTLQKVTHFTVKNIKLRDLDKTPSCIMPSLVSLELEVPKADQKIILFINHFINSSIHLQHIDLISWVVDPSKSFANIQESFNAPFWTILKHGSDGNQLHLTFSKAQIPT